MYYFTADEHYGHNAMIKYCDRPFETIGEMDATLITNHNRKVKDSDTVFHLGDFAWGKERPVEMFAMLNGHHIFVQGSHDKWGPPDLPYVIETKVPGHYMALSHYPMWAWPRSHYASFHLFGHVHGRRGGNGLSYDVGVDCNDFTPVSYEFIKTYMVGKARLILDNPQGKMLDCYDAALRNLVKKE